MPHGFVIPIGMDVNCATFSLHLQDAVRKLEHLAGKKLGHATHPLLVSVRSGAAVSMPGMMDTFLNIGLCPDTVHGVGQRLGCLNKAQKMLDQLPHTNSARTTHLGAAQKPLALLNQAISAISSSWINPRAVAYRQDRGLSHSAQSAVIIQEMVFGNGSTPSGTGVLFTRCPQTGYNKIVGEYLCDDQGESLVSGTVTPQPLSQLSLQDPMLYEKIIDMAKKIEYDAKDMQDIEFTYEKGHLCILQTRSGKRTSQAAFTIAHDMVQEGLIHKTHALQTIDPLAGKQVLLPQLLNTSDMHNIGQGLPASSGCATGPIVFDPHCASPSSILIRPHTSCDDMPAMIQSAGVVTLQGGITSHAAVVMRGICKPCIASLEKASLKDDALHLNGQIFNAGDIITIDGGTGKIYKGHGIIRQSKIGPHHQQIIKWAQDQKHMAVLANADTPEDIRKSLSYGAEGIGLCRSEHMLFKSHHLACLHRFLFSMDQKNRTQALSELKHLHQKDLEDLFQAASGKKLTIRLLDPPLHEFLPKKSTRFMAMQCGADVYNIQKRIDDLQEANPMLGHRGCRLSFSYPELYDMQVQAIFQAACSVQKRGFDTNLALLIPFISDTKELDIVVKKIRSFSLPDVSYQIGTMIETPRACIIAKELAPLVDFFSFGTNDLTQMTWGISRDDSTWLMDQYALLGISDPFQHFDCQGIGFLMQKTCQDARSSHPDIQFSICGEHATQPHAIAFFHNIGIHSISCTPSQIIGAILASAQCIENAA